MSGPPTGFYVAGGTLARDAPCYVERAADAELLAGLERGEFCYILTSRQMGKSSLMVRTAARLLARGHQVAVVDLTEIGQNVTVDEWYRGLAAAVHERLDDDAPAAWRWPSHERLGPLQQWSKAIVDLVISRPERLVIFIDEIDAVRSLPFSTDEFFAGLRHLHNRRTAEPALGRLTFCLLGVASPSDLIRDTRMTPFNVGRRIELRDFTDAEALPLAAGLSSDPRLGDALLRRILYWTGAHPYLTQRLCLAVAAEPAAAEPGVVDRVCEELFFTHRSRERDDNLLFVRERLLRSDVDLTALLDRYDRVRRGRRVPDDEGDPLAGLLRLSGIARVERGCLRVRNRIYERVFDQAWVQASLPGAELRRQRAAYRRGLLRAASVAAIVVAVIGALAIAAVGQRNRAVEQERLNRRLLYAAEMNLAQQAWDRGDVGRVLGLLANHRDKTDLLGFEWYRLWRAAHSERAVCLGHTSAVVSTKFSPDGRLIASGSWDGTARLWDAATCRPVGILDGSQLHVISVAFSPDGRLLASASFDYTLKLWEVRSGMPLRTLTGHTKAVNTVAFSPDGQRLASGGWDFTLRIWNADSGRQAAVVDLKADVETLLFGPDRRWLVAGGWMSDIVVLDSQQLQEVARLKVVPLTLVTSAAFAPDGRTLGTGGFDGLARVWNVATHRETNRIKASAGRYVNSVAFSPDGQTLATSGDDRAIRLWDPGVRQDAMVFDGHTGTVTSLAFSPDGAYLLSAGSTDGTVRWWDVRSGRALAVNSVDASVHNARLCRDGRHAVATDAAGMVRIWDTETWRQTASWAAAQPVNAMFFPSDDRLAVEEPAAVLSIRSAPDWRVERMLSEGAGPRRGLRAISTDGRVGVTGLDNGTLEIWNLVTGAKIATRKQHTDAIAAGVFSPDGRLLATGATDSLVKLWNTDTFDEAATLTGHRGWVSSLAFSPDGRRLVTGSSDGTVKVWDVIHRQELATLAGSGESVSAVAFSPDGLVLAAGDAGHTIRLWRAASEADVATTERASTRMR